MEYDAKEAVIAALEPGLKPYDVSIGGSILCYVSKTGAKTLKLQTRGPDSKMTTYILGLWPDETSWADAVSRGAHVRAAIASGDDPLGQLLPKYAAKKRSRKVRIEKKIGAEHHRFKHGHTTWTNGQESAEYTAYKMMVRRCTDPSDDSYPNYGGRGITVCAEWLADRQAFLRDMGLCPEGWEIDRRDNGEGYMPGNCHWAPRWQNQRNRDKSIWVWVGGLGSYAYLPKAAELIGISYSAALQRVKAGTLDVIRGGDCAAAKATRLRREALMIADGIEVETDEMAREAGYDVIYPQERPVQFWRAEQRRKEREAFEREHGDDPAVWWRFVSATFRQKQAAA